MKTNNQEAFKVFLQVAALYALVMGTLWLLPHTSLAQRSVDGVATREVKRTFEVKSKNQQIELSNQFGEIKVETWNKNTVELEILIEGWGKNEDRGVELINAVTIDIDEDTDEISIETRIRGNINANSRQGFRVDYRVKMPMENPLSLKNKFGYSYIGDLTGDVEIDVSHGGLRAQKLTGKNVEIEAQFASNVEIEEVIDAEIELAFCGKTDIEKARSLSLDAKNGSIYIGEIERLDMNTAYLNVEIGNLHKELIADTKFGGIEIRKLGNFTALDIEASHGSVEVGLTPETPPFNFEVDTSFGSLEGKNRVEIIKEKSSYTSAEYEGNYKGGGSATVRVDIAFGDFKLR